MAVSIVILTYNKLEYTKRCIESIRSNTTGEYEIIIVDNASTDGTREWLGKQKDLIVIYNDKNEGFPAGCNIGIRNSKEENDILLLNNDVLVTKNWLNNLVTCLNSNENIGAVGPITNSAPYYQQVDVEYKNTDEMFEFASRNNKSNKKLWEERQKLIGFCMLIKREALNSIGLLDEKFFPGNYEDDDISIRLISKGYKLILCKDTFIHHYGSVSFSNNIEYSKILLNNEAYFKKKWGFTSREDMNIYKNYIKFIDKNKKNILELFCGTGATGNFVKQNIDCNYYGYDNNSKSMKIAGKYITSLDLSNSILFDYIIISDVNKYLKDESIKAYLKEHINLKTKFIINILEKDNNEEMLNNIFISLGINSSYILKDGLKEVNEINNTLSRFYLVLENNNIISVLKNIENKNDEESGNKELINLIKNDYISEEVLIENINLYVNNKKDVFIYIAIIAFENEKYDFVLPLLLEAYKLDNSDIDVNYNIGYVLNIFGEKELALQYLRNISEKSKEAVELIQEIEK